MRELERPGRRLRRGVNNPRDGSRTRRDPLRGSPAVAHGAPMHARTRARHRHPIQARRAVRRSVAAFSRSASRAAARTKANKTDRRAAGRRRAHRIPRARRRRTSTPRARAGVPIPQSPTSLRAAVPSSTARACSSRASTSTRRGGRIARRSIFGRSPSSMTLHLRGRRLTSRPGPVHVPNPGGYLCKSFELSGECPGGACDYGSDCGAGVVRGRRCCRSRHRSGSDICLRARCHLRVAAGR